MHKKTITTDVLIIGGGLSGLALAGVLGRAGVDVVVIDRDPPVTQLAGTYDARTTALSSATCKILEAAGAWDDIRPHAEPMRDIRVADGASPLFLHFNAADAKGGVFGWNLENLTLRRALHDNVRRLKKTVRHLAPAEAKSFFSTNAAAGAILKDGTRIEAALMVGADGRGSAVRGWLGIDVAETDYEQTAIVCNIAHARPHRSVAVEHFLPEGPFAVLPLTRGGQGEHRSSVVWTVHGGGEKKILSLPPKDFDAALQKLCGDHLGKVRHISAPRGYPLRLMHAARYTGPRTALMAEAAHVIHPIAGQGLNLGMRDVALLSELIVDRLRLGLDIGAPALLSEYEKTRRFDTRLMAGFTDILNRLFSNDLKTVAAARDLGLGIVQEIPLLKAFFARQAMGLGGRPSRVIHTGRL